MPTNDEPYSLSFARHMQPVTRALKAASNAREQMGIAAAQTYCTSNTRGLRCLLDNDFLTPAQIGECIAIFNRLSPDDAFLRAFRERWDLLNAIYHDTVGFLAELLEAVPRRIVNDHILLLHGTYDGDDDYNHGAKIFTSVTRDFEAVLAGSEGGQHQLTYLAALEIIRYWHS